MNHKTANLHWWMAAIAPKRPRPGTWRAKLVVSHGMAGNGAACNHCVAMKMHRDPWGARLYGPDDGMYFTALRILFQEAHHYAKGRA